MIVRIEPKCQTIVRQQVGWGTRLDDSRFEPNNEDGVGTEQTSELFEYQRRVL